MDFKSILIEGLIAIAPEEHKAPLFQLISDLKALTDKAEPHVALLALMKVNLETEERLHSSPLYQSVMKGH